MGNEPIMQAGQYLQSLLAYWWPFCRIMAVFSLAPLFNHKALSVRVRVLLAMVLTGVLTAALPATPAMDPQIGRASCRERVKIYGEVVRARKNRARQRCAKLVG